MRNPNELPNEVRFGFVIVKADKRGKGYGKAMLLLSLKFAFELYGAKRATLGVFENNIVAIRLLVFMIWYRIQPKYIVFWAKNGNAKKWR